MTGGLLNPKIVGNFSLIFFFFSLYFLVGLLSSNSVFILFIYFFPYPQAISYAVGFRQSKTALFDCILLVLLLIVSRVDFIVFVLIL